MARLQRDGSGIKVELSAEEVDVVATLAEGLAVRLSAVSGSADVDDDMLDRLAPTASRTDAALDAELRGLLLGDLMSLRVARLRAFAEGLRSGIADHSGPYQRTHDRDQAMALVEALNDLRIALAVTVGYEELANDAFEPTDRRAETVRLLDALAWLQGGLIEFIESDEGFGD